MFDQMTTLRRFSPIAFTRVSIEDDFWSPRLKVNRERTLFGQYQQCKKTGRIDAFRLDWKPGIEPVPHIFWDSDVAKWIEAASHSLATHPDPRLRSLVDEVVSLVVAAQQPDGYLNVHFTIVEPEKRWTNLRDWHELYSAGHLIEAGVAHYQATGTREFLDTVRRYADYIETVFGSEPSSAKATADKPDKKRGYCGHEEIELALVKLYRATGARRYLELSRYFVEERGRQPYYFDLEARERGEEPGKPGTTDYSYCQAHAPVRQQTEAAGHAVRAMYLYSAMADLAAELNDASLLEACERLWESACLRKMYVTGGIGSVRRYEGFGPDYDLPNEAYAETCAAIGLVLFCHRMLQFDCDSRYADVMERALYNGVISGVSLDGERYFYENPLVSNGAHHRQEWFGCACCPSNLSRLLASLGGYAYSQSAPEGVAPGPRAGRKSSGEGYVFALHLYIGGRVETVLPNGCPLTLRIETRYPWEGTVRIGVEPGTPSEFELRLRIPGWCRNHSLAVNGEAVEASGDVGAVRRTADYPARPLTCVCDRGYARLTRLWHPGDVIELELDMPVERIEAHPRVHANAGRVALQRGPIVYCLEGVDHSVSVREMRLPDEAPLTVRFDPDLLEGVVVIEGEALAPDPGAWQSALYRPLASGTPLATGHGSTPLAVLSLSKDWPPATGDLPLATSHQPLATPQFSPGVSASPCRRIPLLAVPYFAWDNRAPGEMVVWLPRG